MLKEWTDYVLKENTAYNKAIPLLILNSITKKLKPDNDAIPPVLNKGVLSECISDIEKNIKLDKKYNFDFAKLYETKLRNFYMEDMNTGETGTKWIVIPSKKHDRDNFKANVEKLKTLSHKSWCTKSYNAEPYLSEGDFHVYLENGQPKLGVRFVGNKIEEIQGELNNGIVPNDYFDVFDAHVREENLKLNKNAKEEIKYSTARNEKIKKIKEQLKPVLATNDAAKIYEKLGFDVGVDNEGYLSLFWYAPTLNNEFTFSDLGINEQKLFEKVKRIEGNANFQHSKITDLKNLEYIGGSFTTGTSIKSLGKLKHVEESIVSYDSRNFDDNDLKKLDYVNGVNLKKLRSYLKTKHTPEEIFKAIGIDVTRDKNGYLTLSEYKQPCEYYCTFSDLGIDENELFKDVKRITGDALFCSSDLKSLHNLERIDGDANFRGSKITSLNNLSHIGGDALFDGEYCQVVDTGNLKYIGGDARFSGSKIKDLKNIEEIGGNAHFYSSEVENLGKLKKINGNANFYNTILKSLGNLEYIGCSADFEDSKVTDLGNLKTINGYANFQNSILPSLGKLEYIGSNACFNNSQITDLGNLKHIKGEISAQNCKLKRRDFRHITRDHGFFHNLKNDAF